MKAVGLAPGGLRRVRNTGLTVIAARKSADGKVAGAPTRRPERRTGSAGRPAHESQAAEHPIGTSLRFIQQAVIQALQGDRDGSFSDASCKFRPGRLAHQAVERGQEHIRAGCAIVVDPDLEKFFVRLVSPLSDAVRSLESVEPPCMDPMDDGCAVGLDPQPLRIQR